MVFLVLTILTRHDLAWLAVSAVQYVVVVMNEFFFGFIHQPVSRGESVGCVCIYVTPFFSLLFLFLFFSSSVR